MRRFKTRLQHGAGCRAAAGSRRAGGALVAHPLPRIRTVSRSGCRARADALTGCAKQVRRAGRGRVRGAGPVLVLMCREDSSEFV
ncbi:hypothetical protein GCM10027570_02090 [Streptomonospora sediminis]